MGIREETREREMEEEEEKRGQMKRKKKEIKKETERDRERQRGDRDPVRRSEMLQENNTAMPREATLSSCMHKTGEAYAGA